MTRQNRMLENQHFLFVSSSSSSESKAHIDKAFKPPRLYYLLISSCIRAQQLD